MNRYEIGLLTFWNVPNYGTWAQAYAMQKAIQSLVPEQQVRQINHLDKHHENFYYNFRQYLRESRFYTKAFWKSFFVKENESIFDKKQNFVNAYNTIPHTEEVIDVGTLFFQKVVLGSDIVWDFSINVFNHDRALFGLGFNSKSIISYASSFGTVKPDDYIPEYVKKGLKNLNAISVRDNNSADLVEKITGSRPKVVLDPIWLWDFETDANVQEPEEDAYMLIYGQDFTDGFIKELINYSKENGLKMIALDCNADSYDWCDILVKQKELSPYLWVGYLRKATAVATTSFHGINFCLKFNKKFAFCKNSFIIDKIGDFLKDLGLYERFEDRDNVKKMLNSEWDYNKINQIINEKVVLSLEYLRDNLR